VPLESGCWKSQQSNNMDRLPDVVRTGPSRAVSHTAATEGNHWSSLCRCRSSPHHRGSLQHGGWSLLAVHHSCAAQHQLTWRLTSPTPVSDSLQCVASDCATAVQWTNHGQYPLADIIHPMYTTYLLSL